MEKEELLEKRKKLEKLTKKEISLTDLCIELELNEYEVMNLIRELRNDGTNINTKPKDNDIFMLNQGERETSQEFSYNFNTDENHEFKFVAISDTRFGSKSQQLSILNDIYSKAYNEGYMNVIHCGNITEGLISIDNPYSDTLFLNDTMLQVDFITKYYPKIEGMQTYFITASKDETHLKKNKINIGKRISESRKDMTYLGYNSCTLNIDKTELLIFNSKLAKTYTVSYRLQQQANSFRSENKPDIILYGGLLQMDKFTHRNIVCMSIPSVCDSTKEMVDKRYDNTIGAWYITIKTNEKGYLESIKALDSVYYTTTKNDYQKPKVLKLTKEDN